MLEARRYVKKKLRIGSDDDYVEGNCAPPTITERATSEGDSHCMVRR